MHGPPIRMIRLDEVEGVLQAMAAHTVQRGRAVVSMDDEAAKL